MTTAPVGLIGLGLVGKGLVQRLVGAGYRVVGCDLAPEACAEAAALGAEIAPSAAAVAAATSTLLLSLPNPEIVSQVLWEQGVAEALAPGATVLDTTTGDDLRAREHHRRLALQDVRFVDVTLSGSSEDIAAGQATALIGDRAADAVYGEVVQAFADRVFYLEEPGRGCLAKLVCNLVMGLNRAALAEGLALGEKIGLDGATMLAVLRDSAAYSRVMDMKGDRMLQRDYAPASRISQHVKDVRLILELAERSGAALPLEWTHQALLLAAMDAGLGDLDNAALIEVYRQGRAGETGRP